MQRIYVIRGGRGRRTVRVFNIQNEVYTDEIGFVPITVVSQIASRRSSQRVFSRVFFFRNPSAKLVSSIPGDRLTIIKRKRRGRRDPLVLQMRGHVDSPWFVPAPPPAAITVLQPAWPHVRQHQKQYWWP